MTNLRNSKFLIYLSNLFQSHLYWATPKKKKIMVRAALLYKHSEGPEDLKRVFEVMLLFCKQVNSYLQLWGSCLQRPAGQWTGPSSLLQSRQRWWAGCGRGSWGCRWWRWTWGTWSEGTSWPTHSGAGWWGCTEGCWERRWKQHENLMGE